MLKYSKIFKIMSVIFLLVGLLLVFEGFDKKNNYVNSEYSSLNENAYVGGDAYNYIINASYFVGYITLGSACIISSVMLFTSSVSFKNNSLLKNKEQESEELPEM